MQFSTIRRKIKAFLLWSQRYTKTDMLYLASGGFWLALQKILVTLATFGLAIAYANLLPKEVYGIYKYVLSLAPLLMIPTLGGMSVALVRSVARGHNKTILAASKAKLIWGTFTVLGSLGLALYYGLQENITLATSFVILAVFLSINESAKTYSSFLTGNKKFKESTIFHTTNNLLSIGVLLVVLFFTNSVPVLILAYFAPRTFINVVLFLYIRKKYQLQTGTVDPQGISYGKHLSLMNILTTIARRLDSILVFHFLGAIELALYAIAIGPVEHIKSLKKLIKTLALPKLSKRSVEEIRTTMGGKVFRYCLAMTVLAAIYIAIAPLLFTYVFPKYVEVTYLSQIYALSIVVVGGTDLTIAALEAKMAKRALYTLHTTMSLLQIGLLLIGVIFYGILGVVLARVASRAIKMFLSLFMVKRLGYERTT